jgi:hypothetical protein
MPNVGNLFADVKGYVTITWNEWVDEQNGIIKNASCGYEKMHLRIFSWRNDNTGEVHVQLLDHRNGEVVFHASSITPVYHLHNDNQLGGMHASEKAPEDWVQWFRDN